MAGVADGLRDANLGDGAQMNARLALLSECGNGIRECPVWRSDAPKAKSPHEAGFCIVGGCCSVMLLKTRNLVLGFLVALVDHATHWDRDEHENCDQDPVDQDRR